MRNVTPETLLAECDFVRSLAHSLLRDAGRADDVAQHAMMVAARRSPPSTNLRAWFARVVRNLIRDDVRRNQLRDLHERAAARAEAIPSTRDVLEREEQRRGRLTPLIHQSPDGTHRAHRESLPESRGRPASRRRMPRRPRLGRSAQPRAGW